MAKTRSWSVKGIDGDTRDLAREAAQASGMTIGAWIDQAILKAKSGELPAIAPAAPAEQPTEPPREAATASRTESRTESPVASQPVPPVPPGMSSPVETPSDMPAAGDSGADREFVAVDPSAEPRPLAPPPRRPPVLRYAVLGVFFAGLLGVGGWLFVELSSPDITPRPRKIADAAPVAEAPPPPPASSVPPSVAPAPRATLETAPDTVPATAAPAGGRSAELPDVVRNIAKQAQAGDPKSQYNLGMLYLSGRIGDKNPTEAAKWFERAAEQGIANAQFNLGVLYQRGEGVTQNDKLAFFWYQSAAEQNFPQAQHNLATAYAEGKGIAQNYPKAAEWFGRSAEAGLSQSQFSLGALHERGLITGKPDPVEARRWYERALAQGDARASVRLAALDAPALSGESSTARSTESASTPAPAVSPPQAIGRAEIRQIQTLLNRMNFNPGPVDGQMGKRTADAIRLYQKFAGMDEDGVPSQALLEDLRAVAETISKDG